MVVLYDNRSIDERYLFGHGFSCLLEVERVRVLFDVGGDIGKLMYNMGVLGVDPRSIDIVVVSHNHWDHVAGLSTILSINPRVVVLPPTSSSKPFQIVDSVWTTGGIEVIYKDQKIVEQALIVDLGNEVIVITGCSHPGILNIIDRAFSISGRKRVKAVVGGWHLIEKKMNEVREILEKLKEIDADLYVPCHCVPDKGLDIARKIFGNRYKRCGVGLELQL